MKKAVEKLKSDGGVSLMMSLLLFLVCAVVGSAVLVAGTAASGRMAKIAEMDERYYSVNSAANLLIDLFDGKSVKAETVIYSDGSVAPATTLYQKDDDSGEYVPHSNPDTLPLDAIYRIMNNSAAAWPLKPGVAMEVPGKEVTAAEEIYSDGRVVFTVSSADGKYTIQITFVGEKHESQSKKIEDERTITTTKTSITWKLSDVK